MKIKTITAIKNKGQARDIAIKWQAWQSEKNMFYSEILEWQSYFVKLARKFNLIREFKENGIL